MSRLIVKNLPSYITPARLREHFEQKNGPGGTLTDFKVVHKQDGRSRRFGFVGYKTDQEAIKAKEWFDRTFIDSTRISVNVIQGAKDAPAPRPNKRRRVDPTSDEDELSSLKSTTKKSESSTKPGKSDTQLDKFLEVMQPRTKKLPTWANDGPSRPEPQPGPSSAENLQQGGDQTTEADAAANDESIDDMEWMRRRMTQNADKVEKEFEQSDDDGEDEPKSTHDDMEVTKEPELEPPKDPIKETILQTGRLFVRNLAFSCTEEELVEFFSPYGELSQVHIPIDINTKQPKGMGYVSYKSASSALAAYEALDKKSFQGRLLHILGAVDRRGRFQIEEGEGASKKTVKEEKQAKRKAMAGKEFNWGMLYMNSDAVASSIATRLNIDKSSILNPESGDNTNAAVKLALAETHIVQETKTYLASQGIDLDSFSSLSSSSSSSSSSSTTRGRPQRSSTTILVKNIPFGTSPAQITDLFSPHGALKRVLVPPAGTMAVVEYEHAEEARTGFRSVAYRRVGNSVVYLEMGPVGMWVGGDGSGSGSAGLKTPGPGPGLGGMVVGAGGVKIREQELEQELGGEAERAISEGTTLYVKNLSFATTSERLTQMFKHLPSFAFARVQTKADAKNTAQRLSMGYGFIGFKDVEGARKALGSVQGFVLDGHALYVKFAGRGREEEQRELKKTGAGAGERTTKMIVKNVPFEATRKDIQALFGAHGHLKSVRLPKKFNSRTRGFAFLDFVSRAEAENAYETLRHTHLLGRHLVLEWAEEEEQDLEKLRQKAGVGYGEGKSVPWKKKKLELRKNGPEDDPEPMEF